MLDRYYEIRFIFRFSPDGILQIPSICSFFHLDGLLRPFKPLILLHQTTFDGLNVISQRTE